MDEVRAFLAEHNLSHLAARLEESGFDDMSVVRLLNAADVAGMGIEKEADRDKLLKATKAAAGEAVEPQKPTPPPPYTPPPRDSMLRDSVIEDNPPAAVAESSASASASAEKTKTPATAAVAATPAEPEPKSPADASAAGGDAGKGRRWNLFKKKKSETSTVPAVTSDFRAADIDLTDEEQIALMTLVRDGTMTLEQALEQARQRRKATATENGAGAAEAMVSPTTGRRRDKLLSPSAGRKKKENKKLKNSIEALSVEDRLAILQAVKDGKTSVEDAMAQLELDQTGPPPPASGVPSAAGGGKTSMFDRFKKAPKRNSAPAAMASEDFSLSAEAEAAEGGAAKGNSGVLILDGTLGDAAQTDTDALVSPGASKTSTPSGSPERSASRGSSHAPISVSDEDLSFVAGESSEKLRVAARPKPKARRPPTRTKLRESRLVDKDKDSEEFDTGLAFVASRPDRGPRLNLAGLATLEEESAADTDTPAGKSPTPKPRPRPGAAADETPKAKPRPTVQKRSPSDAKLPVSATDVPSEAAPSRKKASEASLDAPPSDAPPARKKASDASPPSDAPPTRKKASDASPPSDAPPVRQKQSSSTGDATTTKKESPPKKEKPTIKSRPSQQDEKEPPTAKDKPAAEKPAAETKDDGKAAGSGAPARKPKPLPGSAAGSTTASASSSPQSKKKEPAEESGSPDENGKAPPRPSSKKPSKATPVKKTGEQSPPTPKQAIRALLRRENVKLWEPPYTLLDGTVIIPDDFAARYSKELDLDEKEVRMTLEELRSRALQAVSVTKKQVRQLLRKEKIELWKAPYSTKDGLNTITADFVTRFATELKLSKAMVASTLEHLRVRARRSLKLPLPEVIAVKDDVPYAQLDLRSPGRASPIQARPMSVIYTQLDQELTAQAATTEEGDVLLEMPETVEEWVEGLKLSQHTAFFKQFDKGKGLQAYVEAFDPECLEDIDLNQSDMLLVQSSLVTLRQMFDK